MAYKILYTTINSHRDAVALGRALVKEKLVACVNILGGVTSIYRWSDELQQESEYILIAKTEDSLVRKAIERIADLHPYECPCVVSLPILDGHTPFLEWIGNEVAKDS